MSWIQPRDAELLKTRFENEMQGEVSLYVFTRDDRIMVPGRPPVPYAREIVEVMQELAALSDKLNVIVVDADSEQALITEYGIELLPAVVPVDSEGKDHGIRFYGLPSGYDFATLLEAIFDISRGEAGITDEPVKERVQALANPVHIRVFVTPT